MPCTTEQKIFIVKAYFRQKSIHAAQLQFNERFGCREFPVHEVHFLLSGHVNSKNNIFWGSTSPEHCLQRPLHFVKCTAWVAISKHGITTSGLWQSTPSDMSRCLASSGQHLVDGEGTSGSSSGSSRMVPPPLLKRIIGMATAAFPWPTDQPQVWLAVVTAFTGLESPRFLSVGKA